MQLLFPRKLLFCVSGNPVTGYISLTSAPPDCFHFSWSCWHCHTDAALFTTQHKVCKCLWDGVRGSEQLAGHESRVGVSLALPHRTLAVMNRSLMKAFTLFIYLSFATQKEDDWLVLGSSLATSLSRSSWKHHTAYQWKEKLPLSGLLRFQPAHTRLQKAEFCRCSCRRLQKLQTRAKY